MGMIWPLPSTNLYFSEKYRLINRLQYRYKEGMLVNYRNSRQEEVNNSLYRKASK